MSKKIFVPLENIRSCLHDLFHEYLDEQYSLERTQRPYDDYDYMDDDEVLALMQLGYVFPGMEDYFMGGDEDEDDDEVIWPLKPKKGKKGKKGKRTANDVYNDYWEREEKKAKRKHHKSKARVIDISTPYSGDEEDPDECGDVIQGIYDDDGMFNGKVIWYYPNYRDKDDRLEFNTLSAFDEFCADEGFAVPPYVGEQIAYRRVSHCCLNPYAREQGMFEIMAEESYADMLYEAVDVTELSQ